MSEWSIVATEDAWKNIEDENGQQIATCYGEFALDNARAIVAAHNNPTDVWNNSPSEAVEACVLFYNKQKQYIVGKNNRCYTREAIKTETQLLAERIAAQLMNTDPEEHATIIERILNDQPKN